MISEEYIEREKRLAEVYELYDLFEKNKISFEEYRKRALELGKKYR